MEAPSGAQTWKLVLAYDGSEFHGWQVQPGRATVQGELSAAIERITGERVLPQGSGRTDAGVHALAQVVSFQLSTPIPAENLVRALNRTLPAAIRILEVQRMPEGFHARHSAREKTYEYRIYRGEICPPWLARYVYGLNRPLDTEAMRRAALRVLGEHDFTSFAASDPELKKRNLARPSAGTVIAADGDSGLEVNVRRIYESVWIDHVAVSAGFHLLGAGASGEKETDARLLVYRVRGNGFLHHMVRNLVGTFLEVGRGNIPLEEVDEILAARDRARAGPTAPAQGLFLAGVDY